MRKREFSISCKVFDKKFMYLKGKVPDKALWK